MTTMAERDAIAAYEHTDPISQVHNAKMLIRRAFMAGAKHGRANPLAEGELFDGTHETGSERQPESEAPDGT